MMQTWQLAITLVLGTLVVLSYLWMWLYKGLLNECKGRLLSTESWALGYWFVSGLIAAPTSWGWLLYYWAINANVPSAQVWGYEMDEFRDTMLFPVLTVFLVSALLWAPLTVWCYERKSRPLRKLVTLALWLTAASSVALFLMAAGTRVLPRTDWSPVEMGLSLAGGVVAFHHVIWDACVWDATWDYEGYEQASRS
jgi:hypothetical protein